MSRSPEFPPVTASRAASGPATTGRASPRSQRGKRRTSTGPAIPISSSTAYMARFTLWPKGSASTRRGSSASPRMREQSRAQRPVRRHPWWRPQCRVQVDYRCRCALGKTLWTERQRCDQRPGFCPATIFGKIQQESCMAGACARGNKFNTWSFNFLEI